MLVVRHGGAHIRPNFMIVRKIRSFGLQPGPGSRESFRSEVQEKYGLG